MKIGFDALLEKFGAKGEKTGWTYISIPLKVTEKLKPGFKKSFRVKGLLDDYPIHATALIPMGEGQFIMAVNAAMRKAIRKNKGAKVAVAIEVDDEVIPLSAGLMECLQDEPAAMKIFSNLPASHQQYYSKWIETAKTDATKIKRIAIVVNGLARNMDFGAMLREQKDNKAIQ
ncbi:MAG TPA: YdeI/OmpD-associated family protein [Ferruginibacter sp.]|nr:YdeI/OmpD-associated family protein [Ferruginibacter sp.]